MLRDGNSNINMCALEARNEATFNTKKPNTKTLIDNVKLCLSFGFLIQVGNSKLIGLNGFAVRYAFPCNCF